MLALLLAILSSPILGAPLATADTPVTMVVTGGTLIDGTGRDPLADSAIPIRDGRVDAVTTGSMSSIPADARRIDARGKWIIPGLIDMHVHYRPDWMNDLFLRHGVTAVRDVGNGLEVAPDRGHVLQSYAPRLAPPRRAAVYQGPMSDCKT